LRRESIPHPSYPFENATHWRMRAEEMRGLAEEARDPMVRVMILGIAADYECFAESADDRAGGGSIMFRTAEVRPESRPDAHLARDARFDDEGFAESSEPAPKIFHW
jgi:hypothetical protein